jgi:hypothetical protein
MTGAKRGLHRFEPDAATGANDEDFGHGGLYLPSFVFHGFGAVLTNGSRDVASADAGDSALSTRDFRSWHIAVVSIICFRRPAPGGELS